MSEYLHYFQCNWCPDSSSCMRHAVMFYLLSFWLCTRYDTARSEHSQQGSGYTCKGTNNPSKLRQLLHHSHARRCSWFRNESKTNFWVLWSRIDYFQMTEINYFQGDLTDIQAIRKPLEGSIPIYQHQYQWNGRKSVAVLTKVSLRSARVYTPGNVNVDSPFSRSRSWRDQPFVYLHVGLVMSVFDTQVSSACSPSKDLNSLDNSTTYGAFLNEHTDAMAKHVYVYTLCKTLSVVRGQTQIRKEGQTFALATHGQQHTRLSQHVKHILEKTQDVVQHYPLSSTAIAS